jgi:hypothetical protein
MTDTLNKLPVIIAGPIVRHVSHDTFTLWLCAKQAINCSLTFFNEQSEPQCQYSFDSSTDIMGAIAASESVANQARTEVLHYQVGEHCHLYTLIVKQADLFNENQTIYYDLNISVNAVDEAEHEGQWLSESLSDLTYPNNLNNRPCFSFVYKKQLRNVLHGSCRKAHFSGQDALKQVDELISQSLLPSSTQKKAQQAVLSRPDILLLTGDQVYIDDVAGPMICAIKQTVELLGLYHENFEGSNVSDSKALHASDKCYYLREDLLPSTEANEDLSKSFFKAKRKPIFTSVNAANHLIALNEMVALYLLSWSSRLWPHIQMDSNAVSAEFKDRYEKEQLAIEEFASTLPAIERGLAHIPVYMIFDDHDVTDDWNLTRAWEEQAYGNPFSKRIVGNALLAYYLFQGTGNPKTTWQDIQAMAADTFNNNKVNNQDQFIDTLFEHDQWQYRLDTFPPVQVLDTRTQRWRSESNKNKPSGLMDWESLCDLQQDVIGEEAVIMVSAAPVYGVKFIEAIQRVFITFGGALVVDAENWMAHRGTASVMLNIFRHVRTPPHFIILSGDVHYSFVYDVSLKFRRNSPNITQFTCSGIHNQFPETLIRWFERLNRWFYGHRSPLNWLTKRRNMTIREREAEHTKRDIVNASSIGLLELDEKGHEHACKLILSDGQVVRFNK